MQTVTVVRGSTGGVTFEATGSDAPLATPEWKIARNGTVIAQGNFARDSSGKRLPAQGGYWNLGETSDGINPPTYFVGSPADAPLGRGYVVYKYEIALDPTKRTEETAGVILITSGSDADNDGLPDDVDPDPYDPDVPGTLPAAPAAPTGIGACEGEQNTLQWTAVSGAASYELSRDGVVIAPVVLGLEYIDSPVVIGQTYRYTLRARNASGLGPASAALTLVPCAAGGSPTLPAPVLSGAAGCDGDTSVVNLSWSAVSGATGYRLRRRRIS